MVIYAEEEFLYRRIAHLSNTKLLNTYQDLKLREKLEIEPHGIYAFKDLPLFEKRLKEIKYK